MGDRGNIILHYESDNKIYLYTHWSGSALAETLKSALTRGRDRWDDEAYLARIIFCEMVKGDINSTTGFGIAPYMGDGGNDIEVDLKLKTVDGIPFDEFINGLRARVI